MEKLELTTATVFALHSQIVQLDTELGNAVSVGRRRVTAELISKAGDKVVELSNALVSRIESQESEEAKAGLYFGLIRSLTKKYGKTMDKFADSLVSATTTAPAVLTDEQKEMKTAQRQKLAEQFKKLSELMVLMNLMDATEVPEIPRVGSGIKRPRAFSGKTYAFSVDGTWVAESDNTLRKIAPMLGLTSAKEVMTSIKVAYPTWDSKNPPETFSLEIGNHTFAGKKISAETVEEEDEYEDEDGDEDEED